MQAHQAQLPGPLAPVANSHARQAHALCDPYVGFDRSTAGQHDLGALDDRMRERATAGYVLQILAAVSGTPRLGL